MNWVFEHNADPDFNDPVPEGGAAAPAAAPKSSDVDETVVMSLVENLGCFTADQVRAAVKHCSGAADRAADWLFSHMVRKGIIAFQQNSNMQTRLISLLLICSPGRSRRSHFGS